MIVARRRKRRTSREGQGETYRPSKAEIRAACQAYQATWSEEERRRRAGFPPREPYTIPEVSVDGVQLPEDGPDSSDSPRVG